MWYVVVDGLIHFTTFAKSQKVLNLRRNPKISVMLEAGKKYEELRGMVIEGEGEIVEDTPFVAKVMSLVGHKYRGIPPRDRGGRARPRLRASSSAPPVIYRHHGKPGGYQASARPRSED
jgi:ribosomal protein L24E